MSTKLIIRDGIFKKFTIGVRIKLRLIPKKYPFYSQRPDASGGVQTIFKDIFENLRKLL